MNWRERIATAPKAGSSKHATLLRLAIHFATCAVGEQKVPTADSSTSAPADRELYGLGLDFCQAIADASWVKADRLLDQIETRAEEVRNEQLRIADAPH